MSADNTGGPAFPVSAIDDFLHQNSSIRMKNAAGGMTLRDYFAVHADIGNVDELGVKSGEMLLGRPCPAWVGDMPGALAWWAEYRSTMRYIEANAMLKAREA